MIGQFHCIQCRSPLFWRAGGVSALATKSKLDSDPGQATSITRRVPAAWVPMQGDIAVVKQTGASHECFGRTTFLGRTAVKTNGTADAFLT